MVPPKVPTHIPTSFSINNKKECFKCGTIKSKINGTPKGVYLIISKLHSILAVANLIAHNKIKIGHYG